MKICVIGLGYIGLPTAILFSKSHEIFGCDINEDVIDKINKNISPFFEPGLNDLLKESNIKAQISPVESDVFIICVPTPFDRDVRMADLRYVKNAVKSIVPYLNRENLVIIESTISPGTCEKIVKPILEKSGLSVGLDLYLSHCPERAIPGRTLYEMVNNDRIIGGVNKKSTQMTARLYKSFVKGNIYTTDIKSAEFVKLMENTYRDVNISLANEFAILAEEAGLNVWEILALANKHPRVNILAPGPGVGGHCIAIDPWFLTESTINARIIKTAREINDEMPAYILSIAKNLLDNHELENPTVTILGVAYKANIDDTRETPALKLIKLCENEGWDVKVHDPLVANFEYPILTLEEAVLDTDLIIVVTDHSQFGDIDVELISKLARSKNILDTRNILNDKEFSRKGFETVKLGVSTKWMKREEKNSLKICTSGLLRDNIKE